MSWILHHNRVSPEKGLTEYVLRTGNISIGRFAMHDQLCKQGEIELVGVPSPIWLGVPLIVDSEVIGVMVVQHYSNPTAYGDREKRILEFVSSQVAMVITRKKSRGRHTRKRRALSSSS